MDTQLLEALVSRDKSRINSILIEDKMTKKKYSPHPGKEDMLSGSAGRLLTNVIMGVSGYLPLTCAIQTDFGEVVELVS